MSLKQKIREDMKQAMRVKETQKLSVLRMLISAINYAQIDAKEEMDEKAVEQVLRREAKKRREAIEAYRQGGREESAQKEEFELKIIEAYLPQQMSEEEIRAKVKEILGGQELNFGQAMGMVMKELKGKADGGLVNKIVREVVGN